MLPWRRGRLGESTAGAGRRVACGSRAAGLRHPSGNSLHRGKPAEQLAGFRSCAEL